MKTFRMPFLPQENSDHRKLLINDISENKILGRIVYLHRSDKFHPLSILDIQYTVGS